MFWYALHWWHQGLSLSAHQVERILKITMCMDINGFDTLPIDDYRCPFAAKLWMLVRLLSLR